MAAVTVSTKYQVVIPRAVREAFNIKPGQKVHMVPYQGSIRIIPVIPAKRLRGFVKGIDTHINHEDEPG